MPGRFDPGEPRQHLFWLATRGAQQMELATRFAAAAREKDIPVLALKGISIADELYGGAWNRPMADVDFLVADTHRFVEVAALARSLGLLEVGASDHALVFREEASGAILELHISLTACPGLFNIDPARLWERRTPVAGAPMFRLSDADLVIHLALHTAFQHTFAASDLHYEDFARVLDGRRPDLDRVLDIARSFGALKVLGAMAMACGRRDSVSPGLLEFRARAVSHCPKAVANWIEAQNPMPPPFRIQDMAFLRLELAPSRVRFLRATLFPAPIPGRMTPARSAISRLIDLAYSGIARAPAGPPLVSGSLPEKTPSSVVAEQWIRECLSLDPQGAELTVTGTCMEPAIREGARIRLKARVRPARVGEVALLRTPNGLRLHRVVLRIGSTIRTKGDTGFYLDPRASQEDVIGVVSENGPRWKDRLRAARSLLRLTGRPWTTAATGADGGDAAHLRLLP